MPKPYFEKHVFDIEKARGELSEFKQLLDANVRLAERKQVLSSFRRWPNLCAMFGKFHGSIGIADLIAHEFSIGRLLRTDLTVKRAGTDNVCLVEFEGAADRDIFKPSRRTIDRWARSFENGFSQVVDWAWAIDTYRQTADFQDAFGSTRPNFVPVLVIGRETALNDTSARDRWRWRSQKVNVDARPITLLTFDELHLQFDTEIKLRQ